MLASICPRCIIAVDSTVVEPGYCGGTYALTTDSDINAPVFSGLSDLAWDACKANPDCERNYPERSEWDYAYNANYFHCANPLDPGEHSCRQQSFIMRGTSVCKPAGTVLVEFTPTPDKPNWCVTVEADGTATAVPSDYKSVFGVCPPPSARDGSAAESCLLC